MVCNKMNSIDIVTNNEEISFEQFISRLFELHRDCNHEHYLSEIFVPFFRMCCDDGVKIVPVYDDRKCGPQTNELTEAKIRMKKICAPKSKEEYVVPDYIFVPKEYSFCNPQKPYLMVETKNPIFIKKEKCYRKLSDFISDNKTELLAEIKACKYVVFTDGIMWMFLEEGKGEIIESAKYTSIELVNFHKPYYKTNHISIKEDLKTIDLNFIGLGTHEVKSEPCEWEQLKGQIKDIVTELVRERTEF